MMSANLSFTMLRTVAAGGGVLIAFVAKVNVDVTGCSVGVTIFSVAWEIVWSTLVLLSLHFVAVWAKVKRPILRNIAGWTWTSYCLSKMTNRSNSVITVTVITSSNVRERLRIWLNSMTSSTLRLFFKRLIESRAAYFIGTTHTKLTQTHYIQLPF